MSVQNLDFFLSHMDTHKNNKKLACFFNVFFFLPNSLEKLQCRHKVSLHSYNEIVRVDLVFHKLRQPTRALFFVKESIIVLCDGRSRVLSTLTCSTTV